MGPWLANNIRLCDGMTTIMAYWSFSDVFEEQGVVKKPFYGGYGLIAAGGIPKAAFNAFAMLHRLGDQRLSPELKDALVTKRADGTLAIAVWNYADPGSGGAPREFELRFTQALAADVTILDDAARLGPQRVAEDGRARVPDSRAAEGAPVGGTPAGDSAHADQEWLTALDPCSARAGADRADAVRLVGGVVMRSVMRPAGTL